MPFLKISDNAASESSALQAYNGRGAIYLLDINMAAKTLILERAEPGEELKTLFLHGRDREATEIACSVMRQLLASQASQGDFLDVEELRSNFELKTSFEAEKLKAKSMFESLIQTTTQKVLLHGDLHDQNIVSAQRQPWLAIDPKGYWGDPVFEVGAWIRNPMPEILKADNIEATLNARINLMSEKLKFEKDRVRDWAYVQSVLAALWTIEDQQGDWHPWIQIAHYL